VKRSRAVKLILLTSAVAGLEGCTRQQCVDERKIVVDDKICQNPYAYPELHGYRWYTTSYFNSAPIGSRATAPDGTVSGVFGGAGDAAGHGGSGDGAGE
jgi:hypothetical protein